MDEVKKEKIPINVQLLSDAIIELNILRRNIVLYPHEHPILKDSVKRTIDLLKKLFELRSNITLGIAKDVLVFDKYTLDKKNPVFREFALILYSKGVAAISFYSGLDARELIWLYELITMREGPVGKGLLELAERKGLKNIKIIPVDISDFGFERDRLRPEASERMIWEDYIYGLLEGKLSGKDVGDIVINMPPEKVASVINISMPENASEETYDKVISTYLRRRDRLGLSSEVFGKFLSFIDNLKPQLKALFLHRAFSRPSSEAEVERLLSELKDEDVKRLFKVFKEQSLTIPYSLKNIIDKLAMSKEKNEIAFDITPKGSTFVNDIEIDKSIIALFEKDNTSVFIGKEYQGDMDSMLKGVETRKDKIAETFRQECGEMTEDRDFSEVILELLQIDSISKEDYLKLLTKLSELVSDFLEMGMFQEICDIYNTIYSHSLSGRFKDEALSMVHYFFQSEQFIVRLVDALKFFGRYNREGAVRLTRVLRLYLIGPLLDALSDEVNPTVRKFLITILSTFRSNVIPEAMIRLNDKRWYVVRNMLILIRECGGKDSLREVIPFTKNENKKVCTEALKTLLHFGDSEAPSCLKEYLKSDDMWLRDQAIILSGTYRVKDIVPDLIELLEKKDMFAFKSDCKISVIRALAQIGDPQAIEPLKKLYSSKTLLNRKALNEIKVEIFKTLNGYPADAIKPLIELGLKSKIEEIRSISKRLLEKVNP